MNNLKFKSKVTKIVHVTNAELDKLNEDQKKILNALWRKKDGSHIALRNMSMQHIYRSLDAIKYQIKMAKENAARDVRKGALANSNESLQKLYEKNRDALVEEIAKMEKLEKNIQDAIQIRVNILGHTYSVAPAGYKPKGKNKKVFNKNQNKNKKVINKK